jgi:hypothetical protein
VSFEDGIVAPEWQAKCHSSKFRNIGTRIMGTESKYQYRRSVEVIQIQTTKAAKEEEKSTRKEGYNGEGIGIPSGNTRPATS